MPEARIAYRGSGRGNEKAADSVEPTALGKSDDYCFFFSIMVLVVTMATITTAKSTMAMHQSIQ